MSIGDALRELGEFLDECEDSEHVTGVELADDTVSNPEDSLTAEVEVELASVTPERGETALSLGEATVDSTGELRFVLESPAPVVPASDHGVDIDVTDATVCVDGSVSVTLSASLAVEHEESPPGLTSAADVSEESSDAVHGREVPPFRDPELLEEVYSSCETFAEMTDAIGMDVTAETVRRYMIDHGIHEPDSYDTDGEHDTGTEPGVGVVEDGRTNADETETDDEEAATDGDDRPVVLTDGTGLPDDVTVEMFIETVRRSNTVLEVKRDLDIERREALDILQRFDMVDLVIGRLDAETERDITRTDVIERLRAVSATA